MITINFKQITRLANKSHTIVHPSYFMPPEYEPHNNTSCVDPNPLMEFEEKNKKENRRPPKSI
jgi:hypothetical protein